MKIALVLSGGGAKGAFQVGVILKLLELGVEFDIISGVSVGCLNGAMVAQGKFEELLKVWQNINNSQVYNKYCFLENLYRNTLGGHQSLYGFGPLYNLIQENVYKEHFVKEFKLGITSLHTGKYHSLSPNDFSSSYDLQKAILASSLMPIVWDSVTVQTEYETILKAVDGGVKSVTPIGDILTSLPDKIYIINCSTGRDIEKSPNNILDVTLRTIELLVSAVVEKDINQFKSVNFIVQQVSEKGLTVSSPSGQVYKYFEAEIIRPNEDLGDSLDFSPKKVKERFNLGYNFSS